MKKNQENKVNMYNAVTAYCDQSTAITASLPAFAPELAGFKGIIEEIDAVAVLESKIITGFAKNKAELRATLEIAGDKLATALFAFATAEGDLVLQQQVNYTLSDFLRMRDDEISVVAQGLLGFATPIVAGLASYGITVATLDDFADLIDEYDEVIAAPRNAAALRKTYIAQLKTLFKAADDFLKLRLDKLANQFRTSNPQFYLTYKHNRKIVGSPTSATQAKGIIINSVTGLPVYQVAVVVEDQEYSATSNIEGGYTVKIPQPGVYTLSFVKEGYQPVQAPNVEIVLGQSTVIDMQLVPAA